MNTLTVTRTVHLDAPADLVWSAARTPQAFRTVTRGVLRFPAIAGRDDQWREGEQVVGLTWLLGIVPFNRHHLTVARIDDTRRTLTSDEHGGVIRSWVHDIVVEPLGPDRCRYTDRVVIDAGVATLPVAAFAWWFYRLRQRRWRRLARTLRQREARSRSGPSLPARRRTEASRETHRGHAATPET